MKRRDLLEIETHLSKLVDGYALLGHVFEGKRLIPLGAPVVVETVYGARRLLEADVVETGEGSSVYVAHCVIGN